LNRVLFLAAALVVATCVLGSAAQPTSLGDRVSPFANSTRANALAKASAATWPRPPCVPRCEEPRRTSFPGRRLRGDSGAISGAARTNGRPITSGASWFLSWSTTEASQSHGPNQRRPSRRHHSIPRRGTGGPSDDGHYTVTPSTTRQSSPTCKTTEWCSRSTSKTPTAADS